MKACELQALEELEHGKKTRNEICFKDLLAVVLFSFVLVCCFPVVPSGYSKDTTVHLTGQLTGWGVPAGKPYKSLYKTVPVTKHCVLIYLLVDDVDAHDDQNACLLMYVLR